MKIKALVLLSGGLDSMLSARLIKDQGIDVIGVNFTSFYYPKDAKGKSPAEKAAKQLGIPLKRISIKKDYIKILRKPKYGHGKGINPCVDCRIYTFKIAKKLAKKIGAKFIITGEVFDQRPMSQRMRTIKLIEKEAGLDGLVLRPMSAKHFPETEAEKNGWVDRKKLFDIRGRSRKTQIALAKKLKLKDYPTPAGGCLLTSKEYGVKARDLLSHQKNISLKDLEILKYGRHFRQGKNKIIVGRNETENSILLNLKTPRDYIFEVIDTGSPTTILQGSKTKEAIETAASLTARYSDAKGKLIEVKYGRTKPSKKIKIPPISGKKINKLRV